MSVDEGQFEDIIHSSLAINSFIVFIMIFIDVVMV